MRFGSFYNQPITLEKGDKYAHDKKGAITNICGTLCIIYGNSLLVSAVPINKKDLESALQNELIFNSAGNLEDCREDISKLNWKIYCPKKN